MSLISLKPGGDFGCGFVAKGRMGRLGGLIIEPCWLMHSMTGMGAGLAFGGWFCLGAATPVLVTWEYVKFFVRTSLGRIVELWNFGFLTFDQKEVDVILRKRTKKFKPVVWQLNLFGGLLPGSVSECHNFDDVFFGCLSWTVAAECRVTTAAAEQAQYCTAG